MENDNIKTKKKLNRFLKFLIIFAVILAVIAVVWTAVSMIGRENPASIILDSTSARISITNPVSLINKILAHETLDDVSTRPELAAAAPVINALRDNPLLENSLLRFAGRGNIEAALLPAEFEGEPVKFMAAWDMGFLSPLLRILPVISGFVNVPNLYYVRAGQNSRFEYRMGDMTLYIGHYRNLLFIANNPHIYESRSTENKGHAYAYKTIKPSDYDAAFVLSNEYISKMLSEQHEGIAVILEKIEFESRVEAAVSIYPKKIDIHLAAPLAAKDSNISKILAQRSRSPEMAEYIPADAQYATILSAGTLNDLYQTALIFTPGLDELLRTAESASRLLLGVTVNDLLFSWTGNEFAVFGIEGRSHPVYAIQVSDERRRREVFDRAFRSLVLNEDARLNLDGMRIPRIQVPEFLQALLRRWDIFLPSPYYIIYKDFILISESAESLLSSLRAMQRNEVLPRTVSWRNIAGGRTNANSFSLYYSLDLSLPFFLRNNTALSAFLTLYRQGLARMNIDRGIVQLSMSLIPGSGNGVTLVNGYPVNIRGNPSNRVYGAALPAGGREQGSVFFSSGTSAFSLNMSDNTINELPNQGSHWIISADSAANTGAVKAWIVTDRGRVTLVDSSMEPVAGFPVITGMRLSSPPAAYKDVLYLCDESGKVHTVSENGMQRDWETSFIAAVRSPPSFLAIAAGKIENTYAAVYPKSFFGEIWLLDNNGRALSSWPAPLSSGGNDFSYGVGFGSPLVFAHNNSVRVAFVNQTGYLLIYDENAVPVSHFPVILEGIFYHQPVFDGEYLWLISSEGVFYRVSLEGEILSQKIPGFSVMEEGHITVFDCDGDGIPEVFFTGEGNALYAFTRNFRSLEGFPLPVWGKPFFVPAQGNKKAEIFGIGMSNQLYRWQFK